MGIHIEMPVETGGILSVNSQADAAGFIDALRDQRVEDVLLQGRPPERRDLGGPAEEVSGLKKSQYGNDAGKNNETQGISHSRFLFGGLGPRYW